MAKYELKRPYPNESTANCYKAGISAAEKGGYKIFKKRELAWLAICKGNVGGSEVDLTLSIPFGGPTSVLLNLSSGSVDEAVLQSEAEKIFDLLEKEF